MTRLGLFALAALVGVTAAVLAAGERSRREVSSSARSREAVQRVSPRLRPLLEGKGLRLGSPIFIRIFKQEQELELWGQGRDGRFTLFSSYPICYFSGNLGPKLRVGDRQSPEGFYTVPAGALNPNSDYHLSFNLGYPNAFDRSHGRTGSLLMVHGDCRSVGCYAMTDPLIEEIYTLADAALRKGQPAFQVHIFPFRMEAETLARQRQSPWYDFWVNLKEGYDLFERDRIPPAVGVRDRRYRFESRLP